MGRGCVAWLAPHVSPPKPPPKLLWGTKGLGLRELWDGGESGMGAPGGQGLQSRGQTPSWAELHCSPWHQHQPLLQKACTPANLARFAADAGMLGRAAEAAHSARKLWACLSPPRSLPGRKNVSVVWARQHLIGARCSCDKTIALAALRYGDMAASAHQGSAATVVALTCRRGDREGLHRTCYDATRARSGNHTHFAVPEARILGLVVQQSHPDSLCRSLVKCCGGARLRVYGSVSWKCCALRYPDLWGCQPDRREGQT